MKNIWMIMTLPLLMLSACSNDTDAVTEEITLTTPVIELGEVSASASRASGATPVNSTTVSEGLLGLYLHDTEDRESNSERMAMYEFGTNGWTIRQGFSAPIVTGGEGSYRAGIQAQISLNENSNMPAIKDALYAHRGSINVQANGTFAPAAALEPLTAAVLVKLKDANGADIVQFDAEGANKNYRIEPSFHMFGGFEEDENGQTYPNGTLSPVYDWNVYPDYLTDYARGKFLPGTYQAGQLFTVKYCAEGFNDNQAQGANVTTWKVSSSTDITLEVGKLYTFTITLGKDAHITLDAQNAVSVGDWATDSDSEIEVGK